MLPVQGDELPAYALELRERHRACGQLDGLLDVGDGYHTAAFSGMVLLVGHDLGKNVRRGLVKLVEVVLLRCGFLGKMSKRVELELEGRCMVLTRTVAWFGLTTFAFPSVPIRASQILSNGGVSSSSSTVNRGLSHRVMPFGSSYRKIRFSKSSSG